VGRPKRSLDVEDLKAMMLMADLEWANAGLIPSTRGTANAGTDGNYMAMRFLDSYRGHYTASMPSAVEGVDEFVGNLLFSIINTLLAQTSAQDPDPIIRPLGGTAAEPDAWRRAWLNQKIVTAQIKEKQYRREVDRAFLSAVLLPFGGVRHGYTPDVEEYENDKGDIIARFKNQTPDMPWIQFVRPWQMRMDPLVNSFDMDGEVGWIAFQNLYRSWGEIKDNPALTVGKQADWKPTFSYDLRPYHERSRPQTSHPSTFKSKSGKQDSLSMYEEWVIYDATRRTYFGYSPGCDSLVREEKPWPLEWGQLPFSILTINEQLDSPFGIPFPQMVWNEQRTYNKVWTIISALINRMRRVVIVNKNAFQSSQGQLENLLNGDSFAEFIEADGDVNGVAHEIPLFQIDGQIVGLLYQLKAQIQEVLGVSAMDRGQRVNVETAAEATQIGAGGQMSRSRIQSKFEAFWTDVIRASHRALLNTGDDRQFFIPIIGEQNTMFLEESELRQGFVKANTKDLFGEFDYGVKMNSTTPIDPGAEFVKVAGLNQALNGMQNPIVNPVHAATRMVTLAGEDSQRWIVSQEQAVQMGQNGMPGEQGMQGDAPTADSLGSQGQSAGEAVR
jgi:hypothetical protein